MYLFILPAEEEGLLVSLRGAVEEARKRGALEDLGGEMVLGAGFKPLPKKMTDSRAIYKFGIYLRLSSRMSSWEEAFLFIFSAVLQYE